MNIDWWKVFAIAMTVFLVFGGLIYYLLTGHPVCKGDFDAGEC